MKRRLGSLMAIVLLSTGAHALDLQAARASGAVGEKTDGYVAALTPAPEVDSLVASVNAKRREEYLKISGQNGQPADAVAKLAAPRIISGLPMGSAYQDSSGGWKTK